MKKIYLISAVFIAALACSICFTGCAGLRRIDGSEFIQMAEDEPVSSFHWSTYIGISQDRAYLEYQHMPFTGKTPRTIVYWTHLSDLPEQLVEELKAGNPPWDKNSASE